MALDSYSVPRTVDDATEEHCSKWFYCGPCGREYHDPFAEIFDGVLVGSCECGQTHTKPVAKCLKVKTKLQRRADENHDIRQYAVD